MSEWKDVTPPRPDSEHVPYKTWVIKRGFATVIITTSHIFSPGHWTMHCPELNMIAEDLKLPSDVELETAQRCALNMAANKARQIAKELLR